MEMVFFGVVVVGAPGGGGVWGPKGIEHVRDGYFPGFLLL